ncbi:polysaccharide biosynthesis tyrosine autokinase [uncultured Ramlibacter sp.]|uniref:polysaccharide biosynthesis tyrosine autokinase n=1 Tax=uncultured Ramlibacter sp. TaxID=260755 RepID=UPI0026256E59|nr:polysaccharide biosynthesis tyrosine autokinase [uncultured Ramlibacter sp.]
MNAPAPILPPQPATAAEDSNEFNLIEYWDILVDHRWIIAAVTALSVIIGAAYAHLASPTFESNLLIQVEDSSSSPKSALGEAASLFDIKTPSAAEIEIIRSRMILGQAVDNTALFIRADPVYLPLIGNWLARSAKGLSNPGFMGFGGFVTGTEKISVPHFNVSEDLVGAKFVLTALDGGRYTLAHPILQKPLTGTVGKPLVASGAYGTLTLLVSAIEAKPGAEFEVRRSSRQNTIESLQEALKLTEVGRQSGVINATLQNVDPVRLTVVLNEIGRQYVRQNIERRAAEAQKTLAFLDVQLPQFKKQLELAEEAYSRFRGQQGTIDLSTESRLILQRIVDLQSKLLEYQQRRRELESRFTAEHPTIRTLDEQVTAVNREIEAMNGRVRGLPTVQQDAIRLERDVRVNNELYQQLRNNVLQLQLVREGKIGNVRLIDEAIVPERPVKPKKSAVIGIAFIVGLLLGALFALVRNALMRGIRDPQEIEDYTGISVYSTIPLSASQTVLARNAATKVDGIHLLAVLQPHDPAIESLRSLRTALQFAMLESSNNRVLITGATPGVGKSFISSNLAAIMASAGKRVLLIDADLRKGYLNNYFGLARGRGVSELIAGGSSFEEVVRSQVLPNLDLLTTGVLPPNPAELMQSGKFARILEDLSARYDLVIMDTPPVLVAADTVAVAHHAGTLLLVARADQTQLGEIHESAKRIAHTGGTVNGVLFNAINLTKRHYGAYGYKYGGYRYRHYSYQAPQ